MVVDWLKKLQKLPVTNFCFILPVNNVDYRKDLNLNKVKLVKLNLAKLKSFATFREINGHFSAKETLKDLISLNKTEIFAVIEVQAKDEKQGMQHAQFYLKRLIHAMRLFDPPSGITEREYHFPETKFHYMIVNLDENRYTDPFQNLHLNAHVWRTNEYWNRVDPDWKQLTSFLYSEGLNEVQSLILSALYWYGDAGKETEDNLSKFLKYIHGLETLLIFDNRYDKATRMAERLAKIFGESNLQNYEFYKNLMIQYYDTRSGIIHAGKLMVDEEDVGTTHEWLRNLIFAYIRFSKKYTDVKTLFKNEYAITL